jgi:hypothetical protein
MLLLAFDYIPWLFEVTIVLGTVVAFLIKLELRVFLVFCIFNFVSFFLASGYLVKLESNSDLKCYIGD